MSRFLWRPEPMQGHLFQGQMVVQRGGFHLPDLGAHGFEPVPSTPLLARLELRREALRGSSELLERMQRSEAPGDLNEILQQVLQRAITSSTSNFPVRENLEAEAKVLQPLDTPLRNRIPRIPGAGSATSWIQLTGIGGGWGVSTTVTSGTSSATQTVGSTAGMQPGDTLYFATTAASRIVSSITSATVVVLTSTISTTTAETVTKIGIQPTAQGAVRSFYAETGAPAEHTETYARPSVSYKLMGTYGSITGFALAAGRNYQDQLAATKTNALRTMMLNEENALLNGSSTDVKAPWGDGSNALGYDGLNNLITVANGTPVDQVQTAVGGLTTAHIDAQLSRLWNQGAQGLWMALNAQEALSLAHLAEASGSIIRIVMDQPGQVMLGKHVAGYIHPVTGIPVDILVSRFQQPGTIIYGSDRLPDGSPTMDVSVLPQANLPESAFDEGIQGYVARDLAPTLTAPDTFPFMIALYAVLRLKSARHVARSAGITAV